MLVLTRKVGERIRIGDGIVITVVRLQNDKVRIGIDAPPNVFVHREEVYRRVMAKADADAVSVDPDPLREEFTRDEAKTHPLTSKP